MTATTVPFTNTGSHSLGGNTQTDHTACFFFCCTHLLHHEKLVLSESFFLKMSAGPQFRFTPKCYKAQCSNCDNIFDNDYASHHMTKHYPTLITDRTRIGTEEGPKSLAAPPTAYMGQAIFLLPVAVDTSGGYNWRHRGDF